MKCKHLVDLTFVDLESLKGTQTFTKGDDIYYVSFCEEISDKDQKCDANTFATFYPLYPA